MLTWLRKCAANLRFGQKILISGMMTVIVIMLLNALLVDVTMRKYNAALYAATAANIQNAASDMEEQLTALNTISYNMIASSLVQSTLVKYAAGDTTFNLKSMRDTLKTYMYSYIAVERNVRAASLVLPNSTIVIGNRATLLLAEETDELLALARKAEGTSVFRFSQDGNVLRFARQIRESNEVALNELAVLIVELDAREIILSTLAPGNVLEVIGEDVNFSSDGVIRDFRGADTARGYEIMRFDGDRYFVTFVRSGFSDWLYVVMTPYNSIYSSIVLWRTILFASTTFCIVLAFLVISLLTRSFTKPIVRLAEGIKDTDAQNVDIAGIDRGYTERKDEVGQLYRGFASMSENTKRLIQENYAKELIVKEAQFKALRMQISPHFLYNTLDSINFLAKIDGHTKIATLVQSLGILLRSSINDHNDVVSLEYELRIAREYFAIQRIRFGDRLSYEIQVDDALKDVSLPKMTLQPILENSIKYALETAEDACVIRIWNDPVDGRVVLCVSDNGKNYDIEHMRLVATGEVGSAGYSIGLYNINQRIRLLFGEQYGLAFTVRDGRMVVEIHLPKAA